MGWWRRDEPEERADTEAESAATPQPPPPGLAAERYRCADVAAIPAGDGEVLVHVHGGATHALTEGAFDLLRRCTPFRTLDDHWRTLARDLNLDHGLRAPVREELVRLADLGLLIPHSQIWRDAVAGHAAGPGPERPAITAVAVLTCDRPDAARRCVMSVIDAARRHGRTPAIVVSDDSRDPAAAASLRREVTGLAADYPSVTHAGRAERVAFLDDLAREAGGDPDLYDALRFALLSEVDEVTPGANRNYLLLRHAGSPFLSLDDDTVCRLAPLPGHEGGLALSAAPDPTQFWFYPDRDAARDGVDWQEVDPLAAHEGFLGRTAATCVAALPDPDALDLDDADGALLRQLSTGSRVAVTAAGLAGDSGMASPSYYLALRGPSRERLIADYETSRETRAVARGVTRPTLSTGGFLMTPCTGLDATTLLPPFLPVGRNEDGVFSQTLRTVAPDALIAHLPWAIDHDPPEMRAFAPETRHAVLSSLPLAQAVSLSLSPTPLGPGGDPATRLQWAGRALQETAALPDPDLMEFLYLQRLAQIGRHIAHLDESLRLYDGGPEAWVDGLTAAIAAAREGLRRPEDLLPAHLGDPAQQLAAARDLLRGFGRLLETWPALFAAARRLNGREG